MLGMPDRSEASDYYHRYIERVPDADIRVTLASQQAETLAFLRGISEDQSRHRYQPDKWSVRQVLAHINDAERVFSFRAWWFARGFDSELPSYDQDKATAAACADERTWGSHVNEFLAVRSATLSLFQGLPNDAWMRTGIASGNSFSVRALAFILVGHVIHHADLLRERYR